MASVIFPELDYSTKSSDHGTYSINRITQQSGGTTVTAGLGAGGAKSVFEIPPQVINLSKSYLTFEYTVPLLATKWTSAWALGCPAIQSIQLATREGLFLCDISNVHKYMNAVLPVETTREELLACDKPGVGLFTCEGIATCGGDQSSRIIPTVTYADTRLASSDPYTGLTYIVQGDNAGATSDTNGANGSGEAVLMKWAIPLSKFKNTILAKKQDLFFGSSVYLNITWNPKTEVGFTSSTKALGTPVAPASDIDIEKLYLHTAIETNTTAQAVARANKSIPIDYVYSNSQVLNAIDGLHSVQVRYSRANGSKLRKIYWVPFSTLTSSNNIYNHDNYDGSKVKNYYTTLNNMRIEQFNPDIENYEDYYLMKDKLKDTVLSRSNSFYRNWVQVNDFTAGNIMWENSYITDGLDLTEDFIYNINATNNTYQLNHFVFSVCERTMTVNNGVVSLS